MPQVWSNKFTRMDGVWVRPLKNGGSIEIFVWMQADKDTVMQMRSVLRQVFTLYGKTSPT